MYTTITLIFSFFAGWIGFLSIPFSELETAIAEGDAQEIVQHAGSKVIIQIDNKEGVYSKSQGTQVLQSFFNDHPTEKFSFEFKGREDKTQSYAFGTYHSMVDFKLSIKFKLKEKSIYVIESVIIAKIEN